MLTVPTPAQLAHELAEAKADAAAYHRVMSLLLATKMEHGLCKPRSRRACTHCNAREELERLLTAYGGPPIRAAGR